MSSIITFLLAYNQLLLSLVYNLLFLLSTKSSRSPDTSDKIDYRRFKVDSMPIINILEPLDFKVLLLEHFKLKGKALKPIKKHPGSTDLSSVCCPRCGAPHEYLYDNNGGRGQLSCKICVYRFERTLFAIKPLSFHCPHCGGTLEHKKTRSVYNIHKCTNPKCSFYLNSLKKLSPSRLEEYANNPHRFKLHYIYREFTMDFMSMDISSMPKGSVNFNFRTFSPHVLGLVLTYTVNCGLSTRVTSRVLKEIHNLNISHVTISKYAKTSAALVAPYLESLDYNPSNTLSADETYIRVNGSWHYVFFVIDAVTKAILSQHVSPTRDVGSCIIALRKAFSKFKKFPENLTFVADGNPIYLVAQQYFQKHKMDFKVTQVIGLSNRDPISKEYRWLKQIIERLNRTFKASYRPTNGFGCESGSHVHVTLFTAYYNLLRPHYSLDYKVPVPLPHILSAPNMPARWQLLIKDSQKYILSKQVS